ncbi:MAG: efflux RND transporter periplasmic adaptor subunit [Planctomycetota bacterium]|nr:MAG: efflux RND transporter periplasmic adaptor subunit [Planctomycetota bacterium]
MKHLSSLLAPAGLLSGGVLAAFVLFGDFRGLRQETPDFEPEPPSGAAQAAPAAVAAEGRLLAYPDADVQVGAELGGLLERVAVVERQQVQRGELLAELRAHDRRAELAEAEARAAEIEADIRLFELELRRMERLAEQGAAAQAAADQARRNLEAAQARRHSAAAQIERIQAELDKTRILAPISGVVVERLVDQGETVAAGDPLFRIADLGRLRVEAEVDEFDAARVALGAPVTVTAEGHEGQAWAGVVEEIPEAVGARRLKPQDPSRPTDVRVLPVKVALSEPVPLKLGQRVEVLLHAAPAAPAQSN